MKLFEGTKIPVLNRALDAYTLRHKVIADNLANIATPGYQTKSVSFEEQLASASQGIGVGGALTDARHIPVGVTPPDTATPTVVEAKSSDPLASGVNGVDLDNEMAELAKNQLRYKFSARLIAETFRGLQKSIRGTV